METDSQKNFPEAKISAAHALTGKTLLTGWFVLDKINPKLGSTGGNFSVCYLVEKEDKKGFMKTLDTLKFVSGYQPDKTEAMADVLNAYNYEKEILRRCGDKKLSKVSRLLDAGEENFPGFILSNVYYMIFEKADDDVRNFINFTKSIDTAWKLRSLHNVATGIKQLHSIDISHQDIKPSNLFVYDHITTKVGDLGSSLCQFIRAPHSDLDFPGDPRYAPPEVFHGYALPEWKDKVFAIDCYLLGSMVVFYFTGQNMTALLSQNIDKRINILSYTFEQALPFWIMSFDKSLEIFKDHLNDYPDSSELIDIINMLCFPDPRKRGHIKTIKEQGSNFQMTRFVSIFDLLASKAELYLSRS